MKGMGEEGPTIQTELQTLVRFMDKTQRSIMLTHNQHLELIRKRAVSLYEAVAQTANSKLAQEKLTTHSVKLSRKKSNQAL